MIWQGAVTMKAIKNAMLVLCILFFVPILFWRLPIEGLQPEVQRTSPSSEPVAFASNINTAAKGKKVLLFATHSHEAYKPIVKQTAGKSAVYSEQSNILAINEKLSEQLNSYGIKSEMLNVDIMAEMKKTGATFAQSYNAARSFVEDKIALDSYDLIIDVHRDAATYDVTTLKGEENYAKVAFVVGLEHAMYDWNLAYAEQIHEELNKLKPGISRGIIKKGGAGVDGIYNQDLAPQMILVELGGIDNSKEELDRTLVVLSEAIANILSK